MRKAVRPRIGLREFANRVVCAGRALPAALLACMLLTACAAPRPPLPPPPPGVDDFQGDLATVQEAAMYGTAREPRGDEPKPVEQETGPKDTVSESSDSDSLGAMADPQVDPQQAALPSPAQIVQERPIPEAGGTVVPGALRPVSRREDELLIVQLEIAGHLLSEGMEAYQNAGGLMLPLGEFAASVDFAITVDPRNGRADGWFLRENRLFALDLARGEVIVDGSRRPLESGMVELHDSDIFVDTRLLARWFPLEITFNLSRLNALVVSREALPIEQRIKRDRIRARLMKNGEGTDSNDYSHADPPYRLVGWPFLDATIEAHYDQPANGSSTSGLRYGTLFTGDLLYLNSRLFLSGSDDDPLSIARLTMGRRDPEYGLLGPLRASELSLGDVSSPVVPLVSRNKPGRGAIISNFPLNRSAEFDRISIEGELPLGWQAELYRNGAIMDIVSSRPDGRYEFTDIPLVFGLNVIRVALYGPQGQKREDIRRYLVGPGMVRPGEFNYRVAVQEQGTNLLPVSDEGAVAQGDPLAGEGRLVSQFEYGLSRNLSVAAGASSLPSENGARNFATGGVRLSAAGIFSQFDIIGNDAGGRGANIGVQTRLGKDFSVSLEHGIFENFVSEQLSDARGPVESRSSLRLDGLIDLGASLRIADAFTGTFERTATDYEQAQLSNRMSTSLGRVSVSNTNSGNFARGADVDSKTASGELLLGGRIGAVSLRGQMSYTLHPDQRFTVAAANGTWQIDESFTANAGVSHQLESAQTSLSLGLSRRLGVAALGLTGDVSSAGSYGTRLTLSFGIGREPRSGAYIAQSGGVAETGAVSARAFLDRNNNGRFDDGDQPLRGIRFRSGALGDETETGEDGIAFLTRLPPDRRTNLVIASNSLEDPYWIPRSPGVSLVPRPGVASVLEFPIVATSEVDGTVYEMVNGESQQVSNVRVQLVDESGKIVKEVRSGYDGFYLFERVIPGNYHVRIDPEQMERLNLVGPPERQVALGPEQVVNGEDLSITRPTALAQGAPQRAAPQAEPPPQAAEVPPADRTPAPVQPEASRAVEAPPPAEAEPVPGQEPRESAISRVQRERSPVAEEPMAPNPRTPAPPPAQTAEAPPAVMPSPLQQAVRDTARKMACPVLRFVVKPGNSLWRIARTFYGSGWQYPVLYNANGAKIHNPNLIYPGQVLVIPWREGMNAEAVAALGLSEADNGSDASRAPECSTHRVVVKPGDNLWRIAERVYGTGSHNMRLFKANRSKIRVPDLIYPGQVLHLPRFSGADRDLPEVPPTPQRAVPRHVPPTILSDGSRRIVVQPGDSLWRIARRAYGDGSRNLQLFRHNHHVVPVPDRIYPGQVLVLPSPEELSRMESGGARR